MTHESATAITYYPVDRLQYCNTATINVLAGKLVDFSRWFGLTLNHHIQLRTVWKPFYIAWLAPNEVGGVRAGTPFSSIVELMDSLLTIQPISNSHSLETTCLRSIPRSNDWVYRLNSMDIISWLERMCRISPSIGHRSSCIVGCSDPPTYPPTLSTHVTTVYWTAKLGHTNW